MNKKFSWTIDLDERLRRSYQGAATRSALTENLDALQRTSGFTRVVILSRAAELGLAFSRRRPWKAEDVAFLREHAGTMAVGLLAAKLNRTHASVKARLKHLHLSARVGEGYSIEDLRQLFGVGARTIRNWIALGWLRVAAGRVAESSVTKFLRVHPEQYRLSRVDEAWFKGIIFPAFNSAHGDGPNYRRAVADISNVSTLPAAIDPGAESDLNAEIA